MQKIAFFILFLFLASTANAQPKNKSPHTPDPSQSVENRQSLKKEMSTMIEELAKLDTAPKGSNMFENDLSKLQAERIIKGVLRIRQLDQRGIYNSNLNELEKVTEELIGQIEKKNPQIKPYSEKVYNACFSCHVQHRQDVSALTQ